MRLCLAFVALYLVACGPGERVIELPDSEAGDIVIVAGLSGGVLRSVELGRLGSAESSYAPAHLELSADSDDVVGWHLRRGLDFVWAQGGPVPDDWVDALEARIDDGGPLGGCGRCLGSPRDGPQLVHAGDRCGVPSSGSVFGDSAQLGAPALEALRRSIVLEWPGECPCPRSPGVNAEQALEQLPVSPAIDPWPVELITQAADGAVGLFGRSFAVRVDPSGARTTHEWSDADRPFIGDLSAGAAFPGGFAVASQSEGQALLQNLDVFDRDFNRAFRLSEKMSKVGAVEWFDRYGAVAFLGHNYSASDQLPNEMLWCAPGATSFDCRSLIFPRPTRSDALRGMRELDNGVVLVHDGDNAVFVFERFAPPSEVRELSAPEVTRGTLVLNDGTRIPWRLLLLQITGGPIGLESINLNEVGSIGSRYFLIGSANDSSGAAYDVIFSGSVTPGDVTSEQGLSQPSLIYCAQGQTGWGGFSPVAGAPDQLRIANPSHAAVVVDSAGRVVSGAPDSACGASSGGTRVESIGAVDRLSEIANGWVIARDVNGRVHRAQSSTTTMEPFELIYGDPEPANLLARSAIVGLDDRFWIFSGSGVLEELTGLDGTPRLERVEISGLPDPSPSVAVASFSGGGAWLIFADTGLVYVDAATYSATVIDTLPLETAKTITGLQEVGPDVFVAIADGDLHVFRDEQWLDVEVEWDDPDTLGIEGDPGPSPCGAKRTYLTSADGVAWVSGCREPVLRVFAQTTPPRAEALNLARPTQTLYQPEIGQDPHALSGLAAMCADRVLCSAHLDRISRPVMWNISVEASSVESALLVEDHEATQTVVGPIMAEESRPWRILARDGSVNVVRIDGARSHIDRYPVRRRSYYGATFKAVAQSGGGEILWSSRGGRLVLARPTPR